MYKRLVKSSLALGLGGILWLPSALHAQQVGSGYNNFDTQTTGSPPTMFDGVPWQGVPIGTFDFGGSLGVQNVGNTDTIMQRTGTATLGESFNLTVLALQLQTVTPVSLGGGPLGYYYATLNPNLPSTGSATILSFPTAGYSYANPGSGSPGTFSDSFTVNLNVMYGSLSGPIVAQQGLTFQLSQGDWQTLLPPPSAPPIVHVNNEGPGDYHVVSLDPDANPAGINDPGYPDDGDELFYPFGVSEVPEPSSLALLGLGAVSLLTRKWRRRTAKA
jgi:hypothetical protein